MSSVTVGPSPLKILRGGALASIAVIAGISILIVLFGFLGEPWLLSNARIIIAGSGALYAGFFGIAVLGAMIWRRPRIEIGPDGFIDYGILGHRSRRWSDVEGSFTIIRVGWPIAIGSRPVVAYRLTDAFKKTARIKPLAMLAGNDEAILICGELAIGAGELADVLNRCKQGEPSAAQSP